MTSCPPRGCSCSQLTSIFASPSAAIAFFSSFSSSEGSKLFCCKVRTLQFALSHSAFSREEGLAAWGSPPVPLLLTTSGKLYQIALKDHTPEAQSRGHRRETAAAISPSPSCQPSNLIRLLACSFSARFEIKLGGGEQRRGERLRRWSGNAAGRQEFAPGNANRRDSEACAPLCRRP